MFGSKFGKILKGLPFFRMFCKGKNVYPDIKVALCCIVKMENEYLRFFVEYYKNLHFDKIFIYDNNDVGGENLEEVIGDYIEPGYVEVIDFRGKKQAQALAYQDCHERYGQEYDWIAYFDCDEFLTFADETNEIHKFLNQDKFKEFQILHINWMLYDDNDQLDNDGRNIVERFAKPLTPLDYMLPRIGRPWNDHIKSVVRGDFRDIKWEYPHTPGSTSAMCCNPEGESVDPYSPFQKFTHSTLFLRHYRTKSIGEWMRNKMQRGFPDMTEEEWKKCLTLDVFFEYNTKTEEKLNYAKKVALMGK